MERRERRDEHCPTPPDNTSDDGDQLAELRATGDAFLAASDDAIRRALSGNSEAFLRATQQRGGQ